jgi:hypothetical protein
MLQASRNRAGGATTQSGKGLNSCEKRSGPGPIRTGDLRFRRGIQAVLTRSVGARRAASNGRRETPCDETTGDRSRRRTTRKDPPRVKSRSKLLPALYGCLGAYPADLRCLRIPSRLPRRLTKVQFGGPLQACDGHRPRSNRASLRCVNFPAQAETSLKLTACAARRHAARRTVRAVPSGF